MKTLLTILLTASLSSLNAQQLQAFDATLNLNMGVRSNQNSNLTVQAGINGRRIPVSLLAGASYFEFQNYSKYQELSKVGLNTTLMVRLASIEFRSMDLNIYSTGYKFQKDIFYEYGVKMGILTNDRTRLYLSLGEVKGNNYRSVIVGAHFSLFFENGYSAY
jgi:hypothetical protein